MSESIKIVFLYSRIVSYVEGLLNNLVEFQPNMDITVVHWDSNTLLPHVLELNNKIKIIPRSKVNQSDIFNLLVEQNPHIIYVSGWMDKDYIKAIAKYKPLNRTSKVVAGIDDKWFGSLRQILGVYYFKIKFKKYIDYFWVSGSPQYYYARKFGYDDNSIIHNLYSANKIYNNKSSKNTKRIVFLGRFAEEKGIIELVDEYNSLDNSVKKMWPLVVIGHGPLKEKLSAINDDYITILPFMQSEILLNELLKGGVFCLPSKKEMWGVVIHELALLGYPLLLSNHCGANSRFLIEGYNGFSFDILQKGQLKDMILKFYGMSDQELESFAKRSHNLATSISTELSCASLLSILYK